MPDPFDWADTVSGYICPWCKSEAYLCRTEHTDGPGPRIHCREASLHNFTIEQYEASQQRTGDGAK